MMKFRLQNLILLLLLLPLTAYPWDSTGHRIIAAIAYDQLTPTTQQTVDHLTNIIDPGYSPKERFLYISTLPDRWRETGENNGKIPHFTNTPWREDGTPTTPEPIPNLVTVLQEKISIYKNPGTPEKEKAIALAYVTHLIGDAHQPLHCISRFSAAFPQGDRGGNLFPINTPDADNLHLYWDQAARLMWHSNHYPLANKQIFRLAHQLENQYPESTMNEAIKDVNIRNWTAACFTLAQHVAYQLQPNTRPSAAYKKQLREVASQQMTLAGYRLANLI